MTGCVAALQKQIWGIVDHMLNVSKQHALVNKKPTV